MIIIEIVSFVVNHTDFLLELIRTGNHTTLFQL